MVYNKITNDALDRLEDNLCKKYGTHDLYSTIEMLESRGRQTEIESIWKVHDEIVNKLNN